MNIALCIPTLWAGGAERVAALLCNEWIKQHQVTIYLLQGPSDGINYDIHKDIKIEFLNALNKKNKSGITFKLIRNINRIKKLRSHIKSKKHDIIFSFLTEMNVITAISTIGLNIPIHISERIHPSFHDIGFVSKISRRLTYNFCNSLVVQTPEIKEYFDHILSIDVNVIPNPINLNDFSPTTKNKENLILAVGRLSKQKDYNLLLQAFAKVLPEFPDWRLKIIGEGEERSALERTSKKLRISEHVSLPGLVQDIRPELDCAAIFAHSARYEGFPNAVLEACAMGVCVVATDAPGAIRTLVGGSESSLLSPVGNIKDFTDNLRAAMASPELREKNATLAIERSMNFGVDKVAKTWLSLL